METAFGLKYPSSRCIHVSVPPTTKAVCPTRTGVNAGLVHSMIDPHSIDRSLHFLKTNKNRSRGLQGPPGLDCFTCGQIYAVDELIP